MTKRSKYDMPAVQNFAFGGIANPGQQAMLRGSDKSYLDARQKELDAFEAQRVAYNDALTKYQTEVYNPYKAQSEAYNAAAQKYNDEVYNPYKTQYDDYTKAIETYNAGDRTADYAGPEVPTLSRTFDMTAPTDPVAFDKTAPVLPFKEEEVAARQKEAAGRAQKDASARGVAIDVASNPDRFNFGSMSVSNRFMAEGGEVMQDDPSDKTAESIIKDFEKFGYTQEEIMELADKVAAAGRGGDELLAYLSPESVEFLKSQGGSGTINPITGLPEFKGGVVGKLVNAVKRVFNPRRGAVPAAVAAGPAAEAAPTGPTAAELAAQLSEANKARDALSSKSALDLANLKEQQAAALKAQQEASTAAQQLAVQNALKAEAEARAKAALPMSNAAAAMSAPRSAVSAAPSAATAQKSVATSAFPSSLAAIGASSGIPKVDLGNLVGAPRATSSGQRTMPTGQTPGQGSDTPISSVPVSQPLMYQNQGVGQVGQVGAVGDVGSINITGPASPVFGASPAGRRTSATNPSNYFAANSPVNPGINAGTTALGSPDMPMYGAMNTMGAIGSNKNLSPTMLGGAQNAGYFTDRMGNQIIAPGMAPLKPPGFAKGGDIDLQALLAQNTETLSDEQPEEAINTNPVGTAQAFLAELNSTGKASPTRQAVKRTRTSPGGGATADKAMQLAYEDIAKGDLGAMKDRAPTVRNTESARSQMEELARVYQIKIRAAQNSARGLSADTFGAPTLEGPTLTKGRLTKKRFAEGGEAKKASVEVARGTGDFSEGMFPGYQKGGVVNALKGTKAVDKSGKPVMAYRGEYGPDASLSTRSGSLTFGSKDAANLYATSPNNSEAAVEAAKVFPSYLSIRKPFLTDPDDPFVDLGVLRKALGQKEFERVVKKNVDYIERTGGYDELATAKEYMSALDVMKKDPKAFDKLYMEAYPVLDDPRAVKALQKRGYDGAIYGGSGATALEPEYRVFSASQAISPYGNKPMAPRSAGQQLGDLARSMEVSPTDALGFLGRAAGVVGSALTPSTTNEGEAAELARRRTMPPTISRADGSPEEGEMGPAFVTPKSGKGRKEGPISQQLKSGDAYLNMAKGVTELPYDIAGAPVDIATMLMRPFGYSTEKPVMGSDFIKEKMTKLGVRPEPPADSTAKGFYTAGELLSNLTNPAGVARKVGPVVEKGVKAGATEVGRQLDRAILDDAGPLAKLVPQAAKPLYAVRPTGSTMLSGPVGMEQDVSKVDQMLRNGMTNANSAAGQNEGQALILKDFWDKKARNYFTRQFGTPDDPIAKGISSKQIKGQALDAEFPEYLIDQIGVGKTRVNAEGQERFFPKYPKALEDFTSRYDKATGIKGGLISLDPKAANPSYSSLLSEDGKLEGLVAQYKEQDKLLAQGLRPELINTEVGTVTRSATDKSRVIGDGPDSAKALLNAYEESKQFGKMDDRQKTSWINQIFGEGRRMLGKNEEEIGKNLLPQNVKTAIDKGEPVYDVDFMRAPLTSLFDPVSINKYLASIPPREAANIRFEDAVKGGLKLKEKTAEMDNVVSRIKAGKPVADTVFSKGVSGPLLQINEGPLEGFAWKRIEKREATVPEGAYVGHSVGGYETGGATYTQDKRDGFNTGKWQVYTLRDNRNRPVNTIEVKMLDEFTPVVTQIKGNGRATGNTAPEKYDTAVINFLQNYLKPSAIEESNSHLTPLLQAYKTQLGPSPSTR